MRAILALIGLHGLAVAAFGDAAWRGFWFGLPAWAEAPAEIALGLALFRPGLRAWVLVMAGVALADAVRFYVLAAGGSIVSSTPVPLSLALAAGLALFVLRPPKRAAWVYDALAAAGLPALLVFTFGVTDYARSADAVVVFGAKAHADLTPTQALRERTRAAIGLYRSGRVATLVFSGGPGEPETMRRMALSEGVPDSAIVLDDGGLNTRATASALSDLARQRGWRRVLAVSHYYHLPRVKLACLQAGIDVRTVPCEPEQRLSKEPLYVLRECVGLYAYAFGLDRLRK